MLKFSPTTVAMTELAERWKTDKSVGRDLLLCLINVRRQHMAAYEAFKFAVQGMKRTPDMNAAADELDALYNRTRDILVAMDTLVRNEGGSPDIDELLDELEESMIATDKIFDAMREADAKLRLSRYAPINDYLQACLNVYGENDPPEILGLRQGLVIAFIQSLEAETKLYIEIRPQAAHWLPNIEYYLSKVKEGVGAVQLFIDDNSDRDSLILGAQTVQTNSGEVWSLIEDMHSKNDGLFTFSKIDAIELLWIRRYRVKEGGMPREMLDEAMKGVEAMVAMHEETARGFMRTLLAKNIREYYNESVSQAAEYERACFNALSDDDSTLVALKDAAENFIASMDAITKYAESQRADTSMASNINEFCEIVAGVYYALVPSRIMRRTCMFLSDALEASGNDDEGVSGFIGMQREAFAEIMSFFETNDRSRLPDAIEKLRAGTAGIMDYYRRKEEEAIMAEAGGVMCMKCGTMNPAGSTYCSKCSSYLMFAKTAAHNASDKSLIDISQKEADSMPNETMKKIEELVSGIVFNSKNPNSPAYLESTTSEVIGPMIETARKILSDLTSRGDDVEDELDPRPFMDATRKYISGLEKIAEFDSDRDLGKLQSGYDTVCEAFNEFKEIKAGARQG